MSRAKLLLRFLDLLLVRRYLLTQFCGHALHYSCFKTYFSTMVQPSEAHINVALDIKKREFLCPLCKAVGNLMVPAYSGDEYGHRRREFSTQAQASGSGDGAGSRKMAASQREGEAVSGGDKADQMDVSPEELPVRS